MYCASDKLGFYNKVLQGETLAVRTAGFISVLGEVCMHACVRERRKCTHTQSIIYHISHRLTRLSASGSPYYINGKCSVEDNTQMVSRDERWHPARD